MDREDSQAIPWLASKYRNLRSTKIIWLQDDVVHSRFYWLLDKTPKARERVEATLDGQKITISTSENHDTLTVRLDDSMMDLNQPVSIAVNDNKVMTFEAVRKIGTLLKTMSERGDPLGMFSSEIEFPITQTSTED